jgi:hypothetical protein
MSVQRVWPSTSGQGHVYLTPNDRATRVPIAFSHGTKMAKIIFPTVTATSDVAVEAATVEIAVEERALRLNHFWPMRDVHVCGSSKPPFFLGMHIFHHANQCMCFCSSSSPHQYRAIASVNPLITCLGSLKTDIAYAGIAYAIALSSTSFPP